MTDDPELTARLVDRSRSAGHREDACRWADPGGLARSLPGLATIGAPALVAVVGDATRFPTARHFKSFTGLTPRAAETGQTDRKGQPMSRGRTGAAAHHPGPGRGQRPPPGPTTGAPLLHPDRRTRREPHQGRLRNRRRPGRTRLDGAAPQHALRRLRHRQRPGHPSRGQEDRRRALDRPTRGPGPATQPQEHQPGPGGEGPSASPHITPQVRHPKAPTNEATFPSAILTPTATVRKTHP
ncbi:transposase [Pseudonocardia lutea]|uniref:Transposase n=1 Tax=Pseudonocardia lutea TaxID=2172015 RepID=A0ABW1ID10_9PSEU